MVQEYCFLTSCFRVIFLFFVAVTFFVALIVIDERRKEDKRRDCCVCCRAPAKSDDEPAEGEDATTEDLPFTDRLMLRYANFLLQPTIKAVVIIFYLGLLAGLAYSASLLTQEFNVSTNAGQEKPTIPPVTVLLLVALCPCVISHSPFIHFFFATTTVHGRSSQ